MYDADATYGIFCGTNETHTIISNSNVLNVNVIKAGEASGNEVSGYYSTRGEPTLSCIVGG